MKKLFVLDASGYLFRSYFAIRNITNSKGESTNALFGFIRSVQKLFKDFHPDHIVAVFDGPNNSVARENIYPDYKAHRSAIPPDLGYQIDWARDFCELMGLPHLNLPNVEADDTMGTVAKWAEKHGYTCYLCTSDKDMAQLVNDSTLLLNTHKENKILGIKEVEEEYGVPPHQMVDLLAMVGDASDNVPGLPGFGPKTAVALLKQFGTLDNILSNPEQVPGKKKQDTIVQDKDKALLSRKLVTIDISVPIPSETDFYTLKDPDKTKLKEFYARMNFNTLIRELEEVATIIEEKVPIHHKADELVHYKLVDDELAFAELLKTLKSHKEISFNTKTTHWQALRSELVGFGFAVEENQAWYIPVNGILGLERVLKGLKPLFEDPNYSFYGHNVKYDLQVLFNYGIAAPKISFDTTLASYLLNSHSRHHSLDTLALEYFGKVKIPVQSLTGKGKNEINLREVPIDRVCTYACEEADYTVRLKHILEKQLKERGLTDLLMDLELPLVRVLSDMECHGIYVDLPYLDLMSEEFNKKIRQLEKEIHAMAGEEFNLNSPKQISRILFEKMQIPPPKKTATGHSTNADVLEFLQYQYPLAGKLLEYRSLEKLRSTYIDSLPLEVNPKTQRIHCNFNQTVAATGRLSCQDPNLQNIPVRTEAGREIRAAFKPQKSGWSFLSADYSQIELRLLAHFSEDPHLLNAFKNHEDIHSATAATIFNVQLEKVTKEQRYQAKTVNFGVIYGQQAYGLAQELGIEPKEASAFINMYFKLYHRVKEFVEECKDLTRTTGKSVTITKRERLIPEIHSKNHMIRTAAERLAVNTPLQGSAADLIKMAMLAVDSELKKHGFKAFMLLQIHDELLFEVPDEELPEVEKLVRKTMEGVLKLKVPLIVDITIGKNWKEC